MSNRLEDTLARSRLILQKSMEITKRSKESTNTLDYESTKPSEPFYNQSNSMSFSDYLPGHPPEASQTLVNEIGSRVQELENDKIKLERQNAELKVKLVTFEILDKENHCLKRENARLRKEMGCDTERDYHIHYRKIQELEHKIQEISQSYEVLLNEKLDKEAHMLKQEEIIARLTKEKPELRRDGSIVSCDEFLEMQRKYEDLLRSRTELQEKYNILYSEFTSTQSLNKTQFKKELSHVKKHVKDLEQDYKHELLELKQSYDKLLSDNKFLRKKLSITDGLSENISPFDRLHKADTFSTSSNHRNTPTLSNPSYFQPHFATFEHKVKENSAKIKELEQRLALSISDLESVQVPLRSSRSSSRIKKSSNPPKKSQTFKLAKSSSLSRATRAKALDHSRASPSCILSRTRGRCKICES
jgi:hypothetical protein